MTDRILQHRSEILSYLELLEKRGVEFLIGPEPLGAAEIMAWQMDETAFWCHRYGCSRQELAAFEESSNLAPRNSVQCRADTASGRRCRNFVHSHAYDIEDWLPIYRAGVYCHKHGGATGG